MPAKKYILKLHLRHGFATMEDEVGGRVRRDTARDRVRLQLCPAVFGIDIVSALDRRAWIRINRVALEDWTISELPVSTADNHTESWHELYVSCITHLLSQIRQ